jgi:calcineurin-like phosphoesterase family protein
VNVQQKRKAIFFTSDWHLFHENSLKFDQRPFKDIDHMHRVLINNYNACVPEDGICYFLGDMGFTNNEKFKSVIKQLNGTKVLILGNHDKGYNAMYDVGFDVVLNTATLYIATERVTLTHCPLRGVFREDTTGMRNTVDGEMWHGETRHLQYSVTDEGQFHLHGHIHSGPANNKLRTDGKQMDVGVPANDYRPVSLSQIESWINRVKNGTWSDK